MSALPGKLQSAFTSGELTDTLDERYELQYRQNGLNYAENVVFAPQGGFRQRPALKDIGAVASDAGRLFAFTSSVGLSYDVVLSATECSAWNATAQVDTFTITDLTTDMLPEITAAQQKDTMLVFNRDLQSKRIKLLAENNWQVDNLPYENLPSYDYGGTYSNGVAAVWHLEFGGLTGGTTAFTLNVNGAETLSITYNATMATLAGTVQTALRDLPGVGSGLTVAAGSSGSTLDVTFGGTDNIALGDGWAISGTVLNKSDAYILANKTTAGVAPGEDIISADQGWPAVGAFMDQRLLVGGFKNLPGAYMFSVQADYFNYDDRFTDATGSRLVPMDTESGEQITAIVNDRNPVILTDRGEFWLNDRALDATSAPNHIAASRNGSTLGIPIVANEGALIYSDGNVEREYRYTDVNGNYLSEDISLLAPHLVSGVVDQATQRSLNSKTGNRLVLVQSDGKARLATILRAQKVLAFARLTSGDDAFKAVAVNGRNEMSFLMARSSGRRLERFDEDLLLDEAVLFANSPASATIGGLSRFNGRAVWCIGDNDVFGPYTVAGGEITLPVAVASGHVGTWTPPLIETLALARLVGTNTVIESRKRIHSVTVSLLDTTSLAIGVNGGKLYDVPLQRFGMTANTPELEAGVTAKFTLRGFTGYVDEPTVRISQLRPGRLHVRAITAEPSF